MYNTKIYIISCNCVKFHVAHSVSVAELNIYLSYVTHSELGGGFIDPPGVQNPK